MKYDIFLSYRRKGGWETAKHLYDLLTHDGYAVSFDIDTLREGNFDAQLLQRIEQCTDFVIILDEHVFDRSLDPNCKIEHDWLRQELAYALKRRKNVIPVMLSGFSGFPDNLPDDIKNVSLKNGPTYSKEYFDSFYSKLRVFLHSEPHRHKFPTFLLQNPNGMALVVALSIFLVGYVGLKWYISISKEEQASLMTKTSTQDDGGETIISYEETSREDEHSYSVQNNTATESENDIEMSPQKMNEKGDSYFYGNGVPQDYGEAVKWYRRAVRQRYAEAQYNLGYCYETGRGVPQDIDEAIIWYRKAAEQGHAEAQCNLGSCYRFGEGVLQNYDEAVKWYRKAAEQGNARGQYNLGTCYQTGQGVTKDIDEAVKWYRKAAEQGYARAQCSLGVYYSSGWSVAQDYDEAVKWYRKAAEQGYARAQYNLGVCYNAGEGVKPDMEEAVKWYRKAAEQGDVKSQYNLALAYDLGEGVTQDRTEAAKWFHMAAEQGLVPAQFNLGVYYYHGRGVPQDYTEAAGWFREAADQGYSKAQYNIGVCYENGKGVPEDYSEAVSWYRKAAEQGHAGAKEKLKQLGE